MISGRCQHCKTIFTAQLPRRLRDPGEDRPAFGGRQRVLGQPAMGACRFSRRQLAMERYGLDTRGSTRAAGSDGDHRGRGRGATCPLSTESQTWQNGDFAGCIRRGCPIRPRYRFGDPARIVGRRHASAQFGDGPASVAKRDRIALDNRPDDDIRHRGTPLRRTAPGTTSRAFALAAGSGAHVRRAVQSLWLRFLPPGRAHLCSALQLLSVLPVCTEFLDLCRWLRRAVLRWDFQPRGGPASRLRSPRRRSAVPVLLAARFRRT